MIVTTPFSSNTSEPCVALNAFNDARPLPSPAYFTVHFAILGVFCVVLAVFGALACIKKAALQMQGRTANVTVMHAVAYALAFLPFTWKLADAQVGCQTHGFVFLVHLPLAFTAFLIRALREWNRAEFAYLAIRYDRGNRNADIESTVSPTEADPFQDDSRSGLRKILLILWDVVSRNGSSGVPKDDLKTRQNSTLTASSNLEDKLRLYAYLNRSWAVVLLFTVLFTPGLIALFPYFVLTTALSSRSEQSGGCRNCDIYLELWIIMTVTGIVYSIILLRAVLRMRGKPDPYGNIEEIKRVMIFTGPLHVLAWILYAIDPDSVDYQRKFSFAWIQLVAIAIGFTLVVILPVYATFRQRAYRTASLASENQDKRIGSMISPLSMRLEDIILNPEMSAKFEKFAEQRFAAESYRFLVDVVNWKKIYYEKNPQIVAKKAKMLVDRYIRPGALLEVNISESVKVSTIGNVMKENGQPRDPVPLDAFDNAVRDTKRLVELGTWFEFLTAEDDQFKNQLVSTVASVDTAPSRTGF